MKWYVGLIICIALSVVSFFLGRSYQKVKTLSVPVVSSVVVKDTIRSPEYYTITRTVRDTVLVDAVTKDTVYLDAVEAIEYVAEMDTVFADSQLYANIRFVSPVPLDTRSYFINKFRITPKTIYIQPRSEESFWNHISFGINAGYGVDLQSGELIPSISLGIQYNIF